MKKNIFDKLSIWWNEKKKEDKELKKIPNDFWLDLNDSDFMKYESSIPNNKNYLYSFSFLFTYMKFIFYGFLLYVISDFMDYYFIKLILLKLNIIVFSSWELVITIFFALLLVDLLFDVTMSRDRTKHKLTFYRRLKKYKK
jgi:hypothetical protein